MIRWLCLLCLALPAHAARKALVIGNAGYTRGALQNPVRDAEAVATKLKSLDFTVSLHKDLTYPQMRQAMRDFFAGIQPADDVLVYYAGHGIQADGENFLLGVEFDAEDPYETRATPAAWAA